MGRGTSQPRSRLAALLAIGLLAAGCGDSGDKAAATTAAATTAEAPPVSTAGTEPVPPELAAVVLAWSEAINRNDNAAAAKLFAPGAIIRQSLEFPLDNAEVATTWNDGLPCAGTVVELRMVDDAVVATFMLGERPGHRCDAPGARAGAAFVIVNGLITLWQQTAVSDDGGPTTPAPDTTAPVA